MVTREGRLGRGPGGRVVDPFPELGVPLSLAGGLVAFPKRHAPRSKQKSETFLGIARALACFPNHEHDHDAGDRKDSSRLNPDSDIIHEYSSDETRAQEPLHLRLKINGSRSISSASEKACSLWTSVGLGDSREAEKGVSYARFGHTICLSRGFV